MVGRICRRENFGFVDVVHAESFEDLYVGGEVSFGQSKRYRKGRMGKDEG